MTGMSVAALLVGVGATTIAFLLLDALLRRPLPVDRPEELVYLDNPSFSFPIVREVMARSSFFASAFAWNLEQYDVTWGAEPEPTLVMQASGTMYETLGVRPFLGRLLTAHDDEPGAGAARAVGVLGYGTWRRRLGSDPNVVGRILRVQGVPITIVGVAPPHFFGVAPGRAPELTVPVALALQLHPRMATCSRSPLAHGCISWAVCAPVFVRRMSLRSSRSCGRRSSRRPPALIWRLNGARDFSRGKRRWCQA